MVLNIRTWKKIKDFNAIVVGRGWCFWPRLPAKLNCSKSNLIWQISGCILRTVSWQLPVPSVEMIKRFFNNFFAMRNTLKCLPVVSGWFGFTKYVPFSRATPPQLAVEWKRALNYEILQIFWKRLHFFLHCYLESVFVSFILFLHAICISFPCTLSFTVECRISLSVKF